MASRAKGPAIGRIGSKRHSDNGTMRKPIKKPRRTQKAAEALQTLLQFLHIRDKRRSRVATPIFTVHSEDENKTHHAMSTSQVQHNATVRIGLSRSWSYFVRDPFDELLDAEDQLGDERDVYFNESYFEDDYCTNYEYTEDVLPTEGLLPVEESSDVPTSRPFLRGIKMGISSLKKFKIENKPYEHRPDDGNRESVIAQDSRNTFTSRSHDSWNSPASPEENCEIPENALLDTPISPAGQMVPHNPLFGLHIVFDISSLNDTKCNLEMEHLSVLDQEEKTSTEQLVLRDRNEAPIAENQTNCVFGDEELVAFPNIDNSSCKSKSPSPRDTSNITSTPDRNKCTKDVTALDLAFTDTSPNLLLASKGNKSAEKSMETNYAAGSSSSGRSKPLENQEFESNGKGSTTNSSLADNTKKCRAVRRSLESGFDGSGQLHSAYCEIDNRKIARLSSCVKSPRPEHTLKTSESALNDSRGPPTCPLLDKSCNGLIESGDRLPLPGEPISTSDICNNANLNIDHGGENLTYLKYEKPAVLSNFAISVVPPDENGNYMTVYQPHLCRMQMILSSAGTKPPQEIQTSISTSSPLQVSRQSCLSHRSSLLATDLSPVSRSPNLLLHGPSFSGSIPKTKKRKKRPIFYRKWPQNGHRHLGELNNRLGSDSSDSDVDISNASSKDYLLLKQAATMIINRIPRDKDFQSLLSLASLVEFLNNYYRKEICKLSAAEIQTISDYRKVEYESHSTSRNELTVENCIHDLLVSALINCPNMLTSCANFAFENLHDLAKCPDFLQAAPELVIAVLTNRNAFVLGHYGFPLNFDTSEHEVRRAANKFLLANKTGNPDKDKQLDTLFQSFTCTECQRNDQNRSNSGMFTNVKSVVSRAMCRRPYHEIEYRCCDNFTSPTNREKYFFQLCLNDTSNMPIHPSSGRAMILSDVAHVCTSAHHLRKIYFILRCHSKKPCITEIGLQYVIRGRKKLYVIRNAATANLNVSTERDLKLICPGKLSGDNLATGRRLESNSPLAARGRSVHPAATATLDRSPHDNDVSDETERMVAVKLEKGEHVTSVILLRDAVLHNVILATNKGRNIRAHDYPYSSGTTLLTILKPPGQLLCCLQALYSDAKTPSSSGAYLQDLGAVWALVSMNSKRISSLS